MKWFSKTYFALYRIILGTYLTKHFYELINDSAELFSNKGVLPDSNILPSYGKLPIILFKFDSPLFIKYYLFGLLFASICITIGRWRRRCALWVFYGWICLLNRNPFTSNPSLAYIGWTLLACLCIPNGERLGFLLNQEQRNKEKFDKKNPERWEVSDIIYYGLWIFIPLSYTVSGLHKLQCESWLDGTALHHVLTSLLARQNYMVTYIINNLPILGFQLMTWLSLGAEITFLFFGTFYHLRKWYWLFFLSFHLGILATIQFGDLTLGMIVSHLFMFDPRWFRWSRNIALKYDWYDIEEPRPQHIKILKEKFDKAKTNVSNSYRNLKNTIEDINCSNTSSSKWILYSILCAILSLTPYLLYNIISYDHLFNNFISGLKRFTNLTLDMTWGFAITIGGGFAIMLLERMYPDKKLKEVKGWWKWLIIINVYQLFAVVIATFTWEKWLQNTDYFKSTTGFHLRDHVNPFFGGVIAYIINQWLFYWWHLARHDIYLLWITMHQVHHSPTRIETATSFYKHWAEITVDSQIMAVLLYGVLGLDPDSSMWLTIFSAYGEYFYHMNFKTYRWIGYFFQRPESHRWHHYAMKRSSQYCPNMSDFPLWDMLNGTYKNPKYGDDPPTGFGELEQKRLEMFCFKDVIYQYKGKLDAKRIKYLIRKTASYALVIWGALNSFGFLVHYEGFKQIGFTTVSSPLPLVFTSFNGVETFSTTFDLNIELYNGTTINRPLDHILYNKIEGSYFKKNVYGVTLSHGPFFDNPNMIRMRDSVFNYSVCYPGELAKVFKLDNKIRRATVKIRSKAKSFINKEWLLSVEC